MACQVRFGRLRSMARCRRAWAVSSHAISGSNAAVDHLKKPSGSSMDFISSSECHAVRLVKRTYVDVVIFSAIARRKSAASMALLGVTTTESQYGRLPVSRLLPFAARRYFIVCMPALCTIWWRSWRTRSYSEPSSVPKGVMPRRAWKWTLISFGEEKLKPSANRNPIRHRLCLAMQWSCQAVLVNTE